MTTDANKAEAFLRQQLKRLENRTHRDDSRLTMKSQLIAIVAAVLVVGCGESQPLIDMVPDNSIHQAAYKGNIEDVKQHLAAGTDVNAKHPATLNGHKEIVELLIAKGADVNAKNDDGGTPLDVAIENKHTETADLLRKHGGKTGEELKAEGK